MGIALESSKVSLEADGKTAVVSKEEEVKLDWTFVLKCQIEREEEEPEWLLQLEQKKRVIILSRSRDHS